jgi:hypothetical protein
MADELREGGVRRRLAAHAVASERGVVNLTDSQRIVLSKAAAREDGAAVVQPKMNKAAAVHPALCVR